MKHTVLLVLAVVASSLSLGVAVSQKPRDVATSLGVIAPTTCVVAHPTVNSWDSEYFCGSPYVQLPAGWVQERISHDDPRFDCATMGHHVCGPNAIRPPLLLAKLGTR